MRPIEVNLASRPFHNNLLIWVGYLIGFAAIAAFGAWNYVTWTEASAQITELNDSLYSGRQKLAALEGKGELVRKEIHERDLVDLRKKIAAANSILLEREFSWTRLLNALEEVQPYKVRLLELRPLVTAQGVQIDTRGIARDLDNFWELQQRLQDHDMFRGVYPRSYSNQPGTDGVMFQISFDYFSDPETAPAEGEESAAKPETVRTNSKKNDAAPREPKTTTGRPGDGGSAGSDS